MIYFFLYIKSPLSGAEFSNLYYFRIFPQLYSDLNTINNNLSKLGNLRFLAANTFTDAWNKAEAGYTYFIDITSNTDSPTTTANRWFGQMWKKNPGNYGWQVAWSFNGTIYKRERNNSDAWTDWNTYALKSDLDSKPECFMKYLNNESVSLKMTHDQNALIIGHSIGNGNPNGHFVYLFCAGNKTSNTGKSFKIAGNFELSYSWADGLNASISIPSSQWIQISVLYL